MTLSKKTQSKLGVSALSLSAMLVIATFASIGLLMQTSNLATAQTGGNVIYKERVRGDYAELSDTIVEGSVETNIYAYAFDTASGTTEMCVSVFQTDTSTDTSLISFYGCGPVDEFTVANGLGDATFSGTVTGFDYATGEEKTVTVSADLTATGKVQTANYRQGSTSPDFKFVSTSSGSNRPASGSLDISGDITVSSDDATGIIAKSRSGSITITG